MKWNKKKTKIAQPTQIQQQSKSKYENWHESMLLHKIKKKKNASVTIMWPANIHFEIKSIWNKY